MSLWTISFSLPCFCIDLHNHCFLSVDVYANVPYLCSNIPESPDYSVYISQLIRYARACSSYGNFIDRGRLLTKKLVDQCYMLEKLKICFRKFYGRYNDQHYNTPLTQILCDLVLCLCVLHTLDLTPPAMIGCILDSTAVAWRQQVTITLPGHLFIHLG